MSQNKKTVAFRIEPDTESELIDYAEEKSLKKSEAGRQLLARALEIENADKSPEELRDELDELEEQIEELQSVSKLQFYMRAGAAMMYIGFFLFMTTLAIFEATQQPIPFEEQIALLGIALVVVGFVGITAVIVLTALSDLYRSSREKYLTD